MRAIADLITTPVTGDLIHGAVEFETTEFGVSAHRLPGWARQQICDPQLNSVEAQAAGVRLVFTTTATHIQLFAAVPDGLGAPPQAVFDLRVDGELAGQATLKKTALTSMDLLTGAHEGGVDAVGSVTFEGLAAQLKHVELWLPYNKTFELVSLKTDAPIEPVPGGKPTWVHYGSSISQGSNAANPTGTWVATSATQRELNLVNLGFAGSALLDPAVARVIRDNPADLISLEVGINIVNLDVMRLRAFGPAVHGFLDTIREGHPQTPLLLISPFYCPIQENTPGPVHEVLPEPSEFDSAGRAAGQAQFCATGNPADIVNGALTLEVVRGELARIVNERRGEDPNLHHMNGLDLFGPDDEHEFPLPDALHPGPEAHRLIGDRFASALTNVLPRPRIS